MKKLVIPHKSCLIISFAREKLTTDVEVEKEFSVKL